MSARWRTIYGLGVGPGDPELLTLKALRILRQADLVAYPAPEAGDSFARRIVGRYLSPAIAEFPIRMNIGDGSYPKRTIYAEAAERLIAASRSGLSVAVLCEGDALFYGSFIYLYEALAGAAPVEIVPGVSSIMACAASAGRALARRDQVFSIIPAGIADAERPARFAACDSAAIIKLGRHAGAWRRFLAAQGCLDRAELVIHATLPTASILPFADWREETAPYFSMVLVDRGGNGAP